MNKAVAIIFLATLAIIGLSEIEAKKEEKFLFRPRPWIPLNIPIPKPAAGAGGAAATCTNQPDQKDGCLTCGTNDATKCSADGSDGTVGKCYDAATCKAPCTCTPACQTTCNP